jgi:formylglycine-generating enzyme required for sulfatase activity
VTQTLLYMLVQRAGTGTIAPSESGFTLPPWESLAETWAQQPKPATATATLGPATVAIGHDDAEADDEVPYERTRELGWDNEHPRRAAHVGEFRIEWRPVTNGEFFSFWDARRAEIEMPKSWVEVAGAVMVRLDRLSLPLLLRAVKFLTRHLHSQVRTLDGPVPLKIAYDWPVMTDYESLSTYASVKGGRLPTEPELQLFFDKFECGFEGGRNVAFRNWHPIPCVCIPILVWQSACTDVDSAERRRGWKRRGGRATMAACGSGRRLCSTSMRASSP